ncbi:MAG: phage tail protein [Actinomycetes bacterium]
MADFSVNPRRLDPYKRHAFRVRWDNRYVPGISRVTPLVAQFTMASASEQQTTEVPAETNLLSTLPAYEIATSESLRSIQGRYAPVQLERGRTHDRAFDDWVALLAPGSDAAVSPSAVKTVDIELLNEAGQLAMRFHLVDCLPIQYVPLGALDANADGIAVETLTLAYRRFECDESVTEPTEPSFSG